MVSINFVYQTTKIVIIIIIVNNSETPLEDDEHASTYNKNKQSEIKNKLNHLPHDMADTAAMSALHDIPAISTTSFRGQKHPPGCTSEKYKTITRSRSQKAILMWVLI